MSILMLIKRIWSPSTHNSMVKHPSNDIGGNQLLSDHERDAKILELLDEPKPTGETIEELAKLMGADR